MFKKIILFFAGIVFLAGNSAQADCSDYSDTIGRLIGLYVPTSNGDIYYRNGALAKSGANW